MLVIIRHPPGSPERGVVADSATKRSEAVEKAIQLRDKEPESEYSIFQLVGKIVPNPIRHLFKEHDGW